MFAKPGDRWIQFFKEGRLKQTTTEDPQKKDEPKTTTPSTSREVEVVCGTPNVRKGSGVEYDPPLCKVKKGDRFKVLEVAGNGWARIAHPDHPVAWVCSAADYVAFRNV